MADTTTPTWRLVPVEPTPEMKRRAYQEVRRALLEGRISRPPNCQQCGAKDAPCSDGRSRIQAHHHDYNKPLEVEWICAKCHRKETPLPARLGAPNFGSANGQSKLDEQKAREIKASPLGCRQLARVYGVDKKTIQRVRSGINWKRT